MDRNEFHKLVWTMPMLDIADEHNVMCGDVRLLCKRYEIPLPGNTGIRDHKASGRRLVAPPPMQHPERAPAIVPLVRPNGKRQGRFRSFVATERPAALHRIAAATERSLLKLEAAKREMTVDGAGVFPCATSPADRDRAVRFVDALLATFEEMRFRISANPDGLRVQCYGAWFRFSLVYRTATGSGDEDDIRLKAWPESPHYRAWQAGAFYGRGTKRIEATFNTILIWLLNVAERVADAEKGLAPDTLLESLAARREQEMAQQRARRQERLEQARRDEERRKEEVKSAADRRRAELAEEEVERKAEAEAQTQAPVWDPNAVMSKQEQFLWLVQTALMLRETCSLRDSVDKRLEGSEPVGQGGGLSMLGDAVRASALIPPEMSAWIAAHGFLHHVLPEHEAMRRDDDYDTPLWLGLPTKAEEAWMEARTHHEGDTIWFDDDYRPKRLTPVTAGAAQAASFTLEELRPRRARPPNRRRHEY